MILAQVVVLFLGMWILALVAYAIIRVLQAAMQFFL